MNAGSHKLLTNVTHRHFTSFGFNWQQKRHDASNDGSYTVQRYSYVNRHTQQHLHTYSHTHTHTHTSITSHWTAVVLQWLNFQNKVPDLLSCLLWWKSPFENLQYVTPAESFELRKCEKLPGPSIQLTADLADEVMDATQVAGGVGSQSGIELCTRWFTNCFRHHRF